MSDDASDSAWFRGLDPGDAAGAREAIDDGSAERPADWPALAVDEGFAADESEYYERLHDATMAAARAGVHEAERDDDKQLIHAVRAMDDCERTANELAERVAEWAGTRFDDAATGVDYARELAARDEEPADPSETRLVALAERTAALADEADELRAYVEETTPSVAPNLAAMAGPVLAARLISLSGGLDSLAKQPSSTVQVMGAEDALFAHLRGSAPSPKHGVIFTHEYVRGTRPEKRGSAARALAGKLTIAARVDHYSGERKPDLDAELDERIATVRGTGAGDAGNGDDAATDGGDDS
ncbi:nucleolar protein-like [Halosimplex carlsbadense 2-9-1]|uniref:Nucleolar protein-like n=1 Tax=Halosimplex carlsbadense 2-9-1 TaxID=797114 RepID=M0CR51_9EURY|nr:NOP5/NOP56 family protein [Halosimplex carlsbadense]ELZ25103.1 nucleolar protein-like [Halosimplex carlsbadense 2-9-1]